jgi:hypothetical protein
LERANENALSCDGAGNGGSGALGRGAFHGLDASESEEDAPRPVLEDEKVGSGLFSDIVERADVRVIERGDGQRLALKSG